MGNRCGIPEYFFSYVDMIYHDLAMRSDTVGARCVSLRRFDIPTSRAACPLHPVYPERIAS